MSKQIVHTAGSWNVVSKNNLFYVVNGDQRISKNMEGHTSKEIATIYCDMVAELEASFI